MLEATLMKEFTPGGTYIARFPTSGVVRRGEVASGGTNKHKRLLRNEIRFSYEEAIRHGGQAVDL